MIYIVHGDDISTSRSLVVNQQKKLGIETKQEIDLTEIEPRDFKNLVTQTNLFGQKELILVDISKVDTARADKCIAILKDAVSDNSIVLLTNKSLPKSNTFIKNATTLNAKIIHTQIEPKGNIFDFADSVFYKNRTKAYRELAHLISDRSDEFHIFSILYYNLKNIAHAKHNSPAFESLKPFQKNKFQNQAQLFSDQALLEIFRTFYQNDKMVKIGELTPDILITRSIEKVLNS
ncbi:hypothetical protein JXA34_03845 [Patescibacteria group bacterium]|nr:hypothetical protein [Patescibacteria group bacterium]